MGSERQTTGRPEIRDARHIVLTGHVQGLGVRPKIARLAAACELAGEVRNSRRGVEIEIEGTSEQIESFLARLPGSLPDGAAIEQLHSDQSQPTGREAFTIVREPAGGPLAAPVPRDRAACGDCLAETTEPLNRRHTYPFTSCTACGPRYSIIGSMPYERSETSMAGFSLCEACAAEYADAGDRRFHAQTNSCAACGPRLWCRTATGELVSEAAIARAADVLRSGRIVAVRGLGGYQLLADATNESAVARLRARKQRPLKPLAVMVENLADAGRYASLDETERCELASVANPIVLVSAVHANRLAPSIHPGLDTIGLLLPTTPLHLMLLRATGKPLVCTSGNRDGEPLEYDVASAEANLIGICDVWLHHNRPILHPVDDSVVRVIAGRPVTIRLARGLAPLPLELPTSSDRRLLAAGGHFKSAIAWSNGCQAALGPHLGDLEALGVRRRYGEHVDQIRQLHAFEPTAYVYDQHPDYFSTRWSEEQAEGHRWGVQHHHAHVAAAMLEHGWLDRTVLGVAWDGTGYGTDGTIWGGEFLIATARRLERFAHLRPFRLPGGEQAIREPWRMAVAMLEAIGADNSACATIFSGVSPESLQNVRAIATNPRYSPLTTSAGRLFDAAAVLILGIRQAAYDGHPATWLEAAADRTATGSYHLPFIEGAPAQLDWRPTFSTLLHDLRNGVASPTAAMRFHRAMAKAIINVCQRHADLPVVLAGGAFQNRLLTELIVELWNSPRPLGLPGLIPPNDGGLAAGQLAIASALAR